MTQNCTNQSKDTVTHSETANQHPTKERTHNSNQKVNWRRSHRQNGRSSPLMQPEPTRRRPKFTTNLSLTLTSCRTQTRIGQDLTSANTEDYSTKLQILQTWSDFRYSVAKSDPSLAFQLHCHLPCCFRTRVRTHKLHRRIIRASPSRCSLTTSCLILPT